MTAHCDPSILLRSKNLQKTYRMGGQDLHVLQGIDLEIPRGQWLAILGSSGSGKSTLLHLLGGLDRPTKGDVEFLDQSIFSLNGYNLDRYRNQHVGFVFQFYHLLPELNVLENVLLAAMINRSAMSWWGRRRQMQREGQQLLDRLGLSHRIHHRPAKLSGGERQRVAIARAMINRPEVLLADEPTGNLDAQTSGQIMELFCEFHQAGQTIVMVTHDQQIAESADRALTLSSGQLAASNHDEPASPIGIVTDRNT